MKATWRTAIGMALLGVRLAEAGIYSNVVYPRNARLAYAVPHRAGGDITHPDMGHIDVVVHSADNGDRDCGTFVDYVYLCFSRNAADWIGWITNAVGDREFRTFGTWMSSLMTMDRFRLLPCGSFNGRHRTWRATVPYEKAQFFLYHDHIHHLAPRHYDPASEVSKPGRAPTYKLQPGRNSADGYRYGVVGHGVTFEQVQVTGFKTSVTFEAGDFAMGSGILPGGATKVSYPAYLVAGSLLVQKHKVSRRAGLVARVMLDDLTRGDDEEDPRLNPAVWIEAVYQGPYDPDGLSNIEVWTFKGAVPVARHTPGFAVGRESAAVEFMAYAREATADRKACFRGSPWEPFGGLIPLSVRSQADQWCWDFVNRDPGTRWRWYRLATEYDPLIRGRVPFAW